MLFIAIPLLIGLFLIVPTVEREERYMEREMEQNTKENYRFVLDEKQFVLAWLSTCRGHRWLEAA